MGKQILSPGVLKDIEGKADKVVGAANGNVAKLDGNGNLVDSGYTIGKSVPSDAVFTDTVTTVVNALNSDSTTSALSAAQGKALNSNKVNTSDIKNNLTTTSSGYVLDARQGKTLNDNINKLLSANGQDQQSDFNNCKTAGTYKGNNNVTLNTPGTGYWLLLVITWSATDIAQIAFEINDARVCSRSFHDGTTWTSWKRLDNT